MALTRHTVVEFGWVDLFCSWWWAMRHINYSPATSKSMLNLFPFPTPTPTVVDDDDDDVPLSDNDRGDLLLFAPRLCVKLCRRRSQLRRKTLPQEQWYGLMSVWVSRWVLRLERWLKLREQTGHLWGDSSMCRILCTAKVRDWQNPFPHSPHLNGFSFEWMYL